MSSGDVETWLYGPGLAALVEEARPEAACPEDLVLNLAIETADDLRRAQTVTTASHLTITGLAGEAIELPCLRQIEAKLEISSDLAELRLPELYYAASIEVHSTSEVFDIDLPKLRRAFGLSSEGPRFLATRLQSAHVLQLAGPAGISSEFPHLARTGLVVASQIRLSLPELFGMEGTLSTTGPVEVPSALRLDTVSISEGGHLSAEQVVVAKQVSLRFTANVQMNSLQALEDFVAQFTGESSLDGLNALEEVRTLLLQHTELRSLPPSLRRIDTVSLLQNEALESIQLPVTELASFQVVGSPRLTLPELETAGAFVVQGIGNETGDGLELLLPRLREVAGDFSVTTTGVRTLSGVSGLQSAVSVGLVGNSLLEDTLLFPNLESIEDSIAIYNNPMLPTCAAMELVDRFGLSRFSVVGNLPDACSP